MKTSPQRSAFSSTLLVSLALACGGSLEDTATDTASDTGSSVAALATRHLYVATTGSDSNGGTQAAPLKSLLKASQLATAGTVVHVAPGTYPGGFATQTSGTATARITYVSDTRWGARIVPPASGTVSTAWSVQGDYNDVIGFEVDGRSGPVWKNGLTTRGSNNAFRGNRVHHIATDPAMCDENGGSGLNATHYYKGVNVDFIGNTVHDIGSAGCKYIQGIYMGTTGNVKNNVVHGIGNWGIHLWHDARRINIANNTIARSGGGITVGGGGFHHITVTDYVNVSNNIVYGNDKGISEQGSNGTHNTYTNNLLFANGKYNTPSLSAASRLNESATYNVDPRFVDLAGNDYRVLSTSKAVNNGSATYAPPADILGVARPQGTKFDIGAYEYVF